ncbi:DUF881 domain-containing protein [Actinomadura livida]|uniref:Uncharacterized protein YlxW (UPF0749 family) n=1 Tax=Actinomadura livida TaxID=79909 RepID=A0A7W7IDU3_9ACTN|nr:MULTISPECIES: DUF881 domain-containing protein [Actinomadura]MBB4775195.1 uncharacterized protein YlxW (UPF0749 family) [Actinomadura catellatispora]GGT88532.1 membrane protein [Actinomadura livida]
MTARQDPGEPGGRAPGRPRRPDASMSLLADLLAGKLLDPGYAEAAARRARRPDAPGGPLRRGRRGGGVLLVLVLTGTLIAVAGAEVRRSEPVAAERRSRLIDEIDARTAETDALRRRLDRLRAETERQRAAALARGDAGHGVRSRLARAAAAAAAAPATGEGLVVTLDDSPRDDPDGLAARGGARGRVYDRDLQVLVNGLWAAGAEAIGVNGQRLTATTAIRSAGEAILVDYRPLTRPYEVTALGDPGRLRDAFTGSAADRRLRALEERYRIRYGTRGAPDVRLPAAGPVRLRYAVPREEDGQ